MRGDLMNVNKWMHPHLCCCTCSLLSRSWGWLWLQDLSPVTRGGDAVVWFVGRLVMLEQEALSYNHINIRHHHTTSIYCMCAILKFSGACCIQYSSCLFWYAKSIWTTNLSDKFCLSKFECHTISGCGGALINQAFQPKQTARPTLCEQSWRGNETQCLVMQKSYTINSWFWQEGTEFQRLMLSSLLEDLGYNELKISESHGTLYIMMCIYT